MNPDEYDQCDNCLKTGLPFGKWCSHRKCARCPRPADAYSYRHICDQCDKKFFACMNCDFESCPDCTVYQFKVGDIVTHSDEPSSCWTIIDIHAKKYLGILYMFIDDGRVSFVAGDKLSLVEKLYELDGEKYLGSLTKLK